MTELEIMPMVREWKKRYALYYHEIEKSQVKANDYWIGRQKTPAQGSTEKVEVTDNVLFEAIETFLPIATRANPEPLVQADDSDAGQEIARDIKVALVHESDVQQLRRLLAKGTRQWLLNRIGVWKVTWDKHQKAIRTMVVSSKRMLFDPDGYVDEKGIFRGEWEGEKRKLSAQDLCDMFPSKSRVIVRRVTGKMGTMVSFIEWWYRGTDTFYTMDDTLLGKFKNPNWNYDIEATEEDEDTEAAPEVKGVNHLKGFTSPYRYLSIFSTGEHPHDSTSLILQNIGQQDKINRREWQIDFNVRRMMQGIVVSGDYYTEEQAAQVISTFAKAGGVRQPSGDPQKGTFFPQHPPLPGDVFQNLEDARSELRNVFGTSGSTPQGTSDQDTVRGKILVNQMDSSRIGGGITDCLEQVADSIYNLWTQFMFVYYDEDHFIATAGATSGTELVTLRNDRFPLLKTLTVTVKEGSLVPKDPLSRRNEAVDLWSQNAIDPLSLYKALDYPDPSEATNQLMLWQQYQKGQIPPNAYLPSYTVAGQPPGSVPQTQPGTGGPAVSPPENTGVVNPPQGAPGTQTGEQVQSQQLLASQPLPK